jgi:gamma-butyrobetaine dioxygenase
MRIRHMEPLMDALLIQWEDGAENRFHYLWLRDNAPETRTANGQRLVETLSIPDDVAPVSVELSGPDRLTMEWGWDGHISHYSTDWLRNYAYPAPLAPPSRRLWDASVQSALPHMSYPEIIGQPQKLRQWLRWVHDYGFAILHDTPTAPGTVLEIVRLFGYVRETNYGLLFDVRSVVAPNNLAFTGLPLSAHTDNPCLLYTSPSPRDRG